MEVGSVEMEVVEVEVGSVETEVGSVEVGSVETEVGSVEMQVGSVEVGSVMEFYSNNPNFFSQIQHNLEQPCIRFVGSN